LDSAITLLRRHEEAGKDSKSTESSTIAAIHRNNNHHSRVSSKTKPKKYHQKEKPNHQFKLKQHSTVTKCSRCGGNNHKFDDCPAKGQTCSACGKLNHYSKCCLTPKPGSKPGCNSLFVGSLSQKPTSQ
jgi:hypothetical protein